MLIKYNNFLLSKSLNNTEYYIEDVNTIKIYKYLNLQIISFFYHKKRFLIQSFFMNKYIKISPINSYQRALYLISADYKNINFFLTNIRNCKLC